MTRKKKQPASGRKTAADKPMTEAEYLRARGNILRNIAPAVSDEFQKLLKEAGWVDEPPRTDEEAIRKEAIKVTVSGALASIAAALLSTVRGTRRGRPPEPSTIEAEMLVKYGEASVRGAAKRVAAITGEDPDQVRSRLRGKRKRAPELSEREKLILETEKQQRLEMRSKRGEGRKEIISAQGRN